jgi:hypothetical protein
MGMFQLRRPTTPHGASLDILQVLVVLTPGFPATRVTADFPAHGREAPCPVRPLHGAFSPSRLSSRPRDDLRADKISD